MNFLKDLKDYDKDCIHVSSTTFLLCDLLCCVKSSSVIIVATAM